MIRDIVFDIILIYLQHAPNALKIEFDTVCDGMHDNRWYQINVKFRNADVYYIMIYHRYAILCTQHKYIFLDVYHIYIYNI